MGKLKNLLIDTAEDEEFNRIERESKQRKEAVLQALHDENERLGLYKDAYGEKPVAMTELMEELAIARVCIRELGDRLAKLEKPWVGLTDEEVERYWDWEDFQTGAGRSTIFEMVRDIEAKLKEKNNG
jgi:hypothetical protein